MALAPPLWLCSLNWAVGSTPRQPTWVQTPGAFGEVFGWVFVGFLDFFGFLGFFVGFLGFFWVFVGFLGFVVGFVWVFYGFLWFFLSRWVSSLPVLHRRINYVLELFALSIVRSALRGHGREGGIRHSRGRPSKPGGDCSLAVKQVGIVGALWKAKG